MTIPGNRLLVLPSILLLSLVAACGGDSDETDSPTAGQTTSPTCEWRTTGVPPTVKEVELPPANPETADQLTLKTNRGDITITLDPANAPCAAGSFTSLAEQGFFDGTKCHRLVVDFVLQCGDPTATGTGGPGYQFADELTGAETYKAGTVAMANSGPDTNGSQFFIMIDDAPLGPNYTIFGKVDDAGLAVVRDIEADGNAPGGEQPAGDVVIESVF